MSLRLSVLALALASAMAGLAAGEDFRLENRLFAGSSRQPSVESTTIFYNGAVYDFMKDPAEITVFDRDHKRFILLDTERRLKTEVTSEEVEAFVEKLRERAAGHESPFVLFLASPEFEQEYDASARELVFRSQWLTYRVVTQDAGSSEAASQYRQYADWQARLNAVLNPRAIPPFGRLVVNAELEHREEIPSEVHLTLVPAGVLPRRRISLRSEHQLVRRVVASDRARVQQVGQFMAIFQTVSFEEYQKGYSGP